MQAEGAALKNDETGGEPGLFDAGGVQDHVLAGTSGIDGKDKIAPRSGRGRPPGARNKATMAERERILENINPIDNLVALASMSIKELSSRLGMKMADAAEYYRKLQLDLSQFTHSKMPQAVIMTTLPPLPVNMYFDGDDEGEAEEAFTIDVTPINSSTYGDCDQPVTAPPSPHTAKPLKEQGQFDEGT